MAVIESIIKTDSIGRWYIEISDTMKEDSSEICYDIEDYAKKVEKMGEDYGPSVEIMWSSDEGVTPTQIHEVRMQIMAHEARIEQEKQDGEGTPYK